MNPDTDSATLLEPEQATLTRPPPPLYRVVLLNDDYTPMNFVVEVLQRFFGMETRRATAVMLKVHHEGRGLCGVFPREIAEAKVTQVTRHARGYQHPLRCVMEEDR
ncbi:MAG: ATP-dependent Clp protease adapter ClpS [Zoogloeaceae bacterium]|jgi:ATP-dependent Clp protease adaptor protein ClpS|nr:ATP-dependent Clp protease adapter ClpS [Zoogloeaceae bacterium]